LDKYYATGRRKNSIAKVWLTKGDGEIKINKRDIKEYFPRDFWVKNALEALDVTETTNDFNFNISVLGGGLTGQSGAVRLGISKAILLYNESFRSKLKSRGLWQELGGTKRRTSVQRADLPWGGQGTASALP
jgi:small subunit ribosomal protein S9